MSITRFEQHFEEKVKKSAINLIKPSTELIPDVYDVKFDGTECVHIFVAKEELVQSCRELLEKLNIYILDQHIHSMESSNEVVNTLESVASAQKKATLLLMMFWGYSIHDGEFNLDDNSNLPFHKIWSIFLSSKCQIFRDQPKIFFFNVIKSPTKNVLDGTLYKGSPYEVPNEADVLIIYKHNDDLKESEIFVDALSEKIGLYGNTEDLRTLVTIIDTNHFTRPVIISTMLKTLFLSPSQIRGQYYRLETTHQHTLSELKKANDILENKKKEKMQQSSSGFKNTLRKITSSFRSKPGSGNSASKYPQQKDNGNLKRNELESQQANKSSTSSNNTQGKIQKDENRKFSAEKNVPRVSTDKASRRSSVNKTQTPVKKLSREEKKPWRY